MDLHYSDVVLMYMFSVFKAMEYGIKVVFLLVLK